MVCVVCALDRSSRVLPDYVWCVCCEVCLLFAACVICLLLSASHFLAHPLTTLLCFAALFVDDGARCVQSVSLPRSCVCLCVFVVFVVCGGGVVVLCGVCCICLLCVIMCAVCAIKGCVSVCV